MDMGYKQRDPFYGQRCWLRVREQALIRDRYQCVWCRQAGRRARDAKGRAIPVPATLVHHIRPRSEAPELALELDNLVSLCARCHDEAHPEKHGAAREEIPEAARGIKIERL